MIYLFDNNEEFIQVVNELDSWQTEEVNKYSFLEVTLPYSTNVEKAFYLGHKDYADSSKFHLYRIENVEKDNEATINITAINSFYDDMESDGYIEDYRPKDKSITEVVGRILLDSRWGVGNISSNRTITTNFYYSNRKEALSKIIEATGFIIRPRVVFDKNKIIGRYVDVLEDLGNDNGKVFVHGKDLLTVSEKSNKGLIYTAVIGRGKGEETENGGYGRRLKFTDVVWSKANGNPVDKPAGQDFLEIPEATSKYGFNNGTKKRLKVIEFQEVTDPNVLIQMSYDWLEKNSRPQYEYKATVLNTGNVELGDTVGIVNHKLNIKYKTRVFKIKRNLLNNKLTEFSVGDKLSSSEHERTTNTVNKAISDLKEEIQVVDFEKKLEEDRKLFEQMFEARKTDIVTSVEKGIEKAKDDAKVYADGLASEINEELEEIRSEAVKQNELNEQAIDDLNESVNEAVESLNEAKAKIDSIEIPDVNSIVDSKISTAKTEIDTAMNDKISKIPKPEIGGRNYVLNSNECTTERRKDYKLATQDLSVFRGRTVIISVDVETREASGEFQGKARTGAECKIGFFDGTVSYALQIFTSNPNFKGRISHKVAIPDKEISYMNLYTLNHWANGFSQTCRPMIEIANVESDYRPADEDMSHTIETKANEIIERLEKTEGKFDENGKLVGLSDIETKVTRTAGQVEEAHRKLDANFNADGTVKDRSSLATTITNSVDGVNREIRKVNERFNNDGSLKEFKEFTNKIGETAEGTKQVLDSVKRYINKDGTIKDTLNRHIENKTSEVFEREISKTERGIITKSNFKETATESMKEYIQKVDNLKLGTRNYVLGSNECTTEKQKNYKLATDDLSMFRGKTVIVSVDVETRNASGKVNNRTRTGFELNVVLADGTNFLGAQIFTNQSNFKGRISHKVTLPDKEIRNIYAYVQNEWANGFSQTCKPMLEIATVESDYQPAHEDMSDKIAKYQEGVDRKLSELTDSTNDNKTAISKVVQTAKEISNQITFDSNGNVKFREVKLDAEGNKISHTDKTLNGTTIANIIQQDQEGTRILTEKVLEDGRKVASSIVNTGSGINLISDSVRVTSSNENLVSSELLNVTTRRRGRIRLTPIFENKGDYKLSNTDQFIFKARAKNNTGSSDLNPQLVTIDSSGQESWQHLSTMFRSSNKDFTNVIYEGNLNDKNIANATKYYFAFWADVSTEYEYEDLSIVKKKDASFIVDGSIKGKHLDMDSARIGILTTGVILNKHLDTNSVTSDKMLVNEAMIEKLLTNVHVTNKLWANEAFVNKVNSIEISANRIKTGWLESKNRWLAIGMENGSTWYRGDATINFESSNNVFQRSRGGTTAFLKFQDDSYGGAYTTLGVNADGDKKLKPNEDYSGGTFAGIRIIRQYKKGDNYSRNLIDKVQLVADRVAFAPEQKNATEFLHIDYWEFKDLKINAPIKLIKFLKKVSEYTKISLTSP